MDLNEKSNRWSVLIWCCLQLAGLALGNHVPMILDFSSRRIIQGDGHDASLVDDKDVKTGIVISDAFPQQQWLEASWVSEPTVNGVWLFTDEQKMTSGTLKFYVDGVECPNTSGVGLDAIGGVFNCGLKGSRFRVVCSETCKPNFAIRELKLWKAKVLNLNAEDNFYNLPENDLVSKARPQSSQDITRIFLKGSFSINKWESSYVIQQGNSANPGVCMGLPSKAYVTGFVTSAHDAHSSLFRITVQNSKIGWINDYVVEGKRIWDIQRIPEYNVITGAWVFTDFCFFRVNDPLMITNKIITLGFLCNDPESTMPLIKVWTPPATLKPDSVNQQFEFAGPEWFFCDDIVLATDLDFEFYDVTPGLMKETLNEFISIDKASNIIKVTIVAEAFKLYNQQTLWVGIKAKMLNAPYRERFDKSFSIFFKSLEIALCSTATFTSPKGIPVGLQVQVYAEEPTEITLEQIIDTGTIQLAQTIGFETVSCGPYKAIIKQGTTLVQFDGESQQKLLAKTVDQNLIGKQLLEIEIWAIRWQNLHTSIFGEIEVLPCDVQRLVESEEATAKPFSALMMTFKLPFAEKVQLPMLQPEPRCGKTNADLTYAFANTVPSWVTLDERKRVVDIEATDVDLFGSNVPIEVKMTFGKLTEKVSFAIVFIEQIDEQPVPDPENESKSEETQSDEDEEEKSPEQPEVVAWDGWKSLLDLAGDLLPDGVSLPAPNTDPDYVPTPPVAKLTTISARGKTRIEFNEDVFEYENLKNLMVPKLHTISDGRMLLNQGLYELVPLIEVTLEPGESSDPSKLNFNYTVEFADSRSIEIEIKWADAPYISANQPEDFLVINFNGPIFDKEDGLEMEIEFKTLRHAIPPQLELGALADAIEDAGGSLQVTSATTLAGNAVINLLLAGSLNQVWGMVNNLQIVLHTPLMNLQFPANAFLIYDVMISVATFDILPTDDIYPSFFPDLPEDNPFTEKFDRMNIGSRFLIMNMGTVLLIFAFYVILFLMYPFCRALRNQVKCAKKGTKKMHAMLFWSHPILFLLEGYMDIMITATINLIFVKDGLPWNQPSLLVTNALSIFMISSCAFLFFFTAIYLWPRYDKLKTKEYRSRFHPIYEMLNLRHGKATLLWPLVFMLRRALFVVAVCVLIERIEMQIFLFMIPTLASMVILAWIKPLETSSANRLEVFNSCMILLMSYCLMSFTAMVEDPRARYEMGFIMVGLTGLNILINIVAVSIEPIRRSCMRCKVCWAKRKICCVYRRNTERSNSDVNQEVIDQQNKLPTISEEEYSDSDASFDSDLDSDEEVEKKLERLRARFKAMKTVKGKQIDEMNAEAVKVLEERAAIQASRHSKMTKENNIGLGTFSRPAKSKYQLPNIDDLIKPQAPKRSKVTKRTSELLTVSRPTDLVPDRVTQLGGMSARENSARLLLIDDQDSESLRSLRRNHLNEERGPQIVVTRATGQTAHLNINLVDNQSYQNGTARGTANATGRSSSAVNDFDQIPSGSVSQRNQGAMLHTMPKKIPLLRNSKLSTQMTIWPPQTTYIREQPAEGEVLGLSKTSVATPRALGQTTMMEDGQTVLFPTLYTEWFGVQKKKHGASGALPTSQSSKKLYTTQTIELKPAKELKAQISARQSETSVDISSIKDHKQKLRDQLTAKFLLAQSISASQDGRSQQQPLDSSRANGSKNAVKTLAGGIAAKLDKASGKGSDSSSETYEIEKCKRTKKLAHATNLIMTIQRLNKGSND